MSMKSTIKYVSKHETDDMFFSLFIGKLNLATVNSHYNTFLGTREICLLYQGFKNNTIQRKYEIRDRQNYLVIITVCCISAHYNESPLYIYQPYHWHLAGHYQAQSAIWHSKFKTPPPPPPPHFKSKTGAEQIWPPENLSHTKYNPTGRKKIVRSPAFSMVYLYHTTQRILIGKEYSFVASK